MRRECLKPGQEIGCEGNLIEAPAGGAFPILVGFLQERVADNKVVALIKSRYWFEVDLSVDMKQP